MQSIENIKAIKYDNILHTTKQSAEHTNKKIIIGFLKYILQINYFLLNKKNKYNKKEK